MPDIFAQYEQLKNKRIAAINRRIRLFYEKAIQEVEVVLRSVKYNGKKFDLSDYPVLNRKVESITRKLHESVYALTVNGIEDMWDLSNKKNNVIVDHRLAGKRIKKNARQVLFDPNKEALQQFLDRKEKGMDLSDRVWNTIQPFKHELEQTIGVGMGMGESAKSIAKKAKQYLNNPDMLFRRVRSEDGELHLSARARNYHPGQGVYRSSYKNSMRLTRTENNMSYRTSDHLRWQNMPFVIGIEVRLSGSHPRYDICDQLKGSYPKDFKFVGWHPQCLCNAVPKMVSDAEFEKMEDQLLEGDEEVTFQPKGTVTKPPTGFNKWLNDNGERVKGWKSEPYWMRDNPEYIAKAKKARVPDNVLDRIGKDENYKEQFEWAQKAIDRWRSGDAAKSWDLSGIDEYGLSDTEATLIYSYTSQAYRPLNRQLNSGKVSAQTRLFEEALNEVLDKIPVHSGKVIRQYLVEPGAPSAESLLEIYSKSEVVVFDSFLSTSKDLKFNWDGEVTYHIQSKTGRSINKISAHSHEQEVLFKSKTAFKIVKVEGKNVYLEELDG
jgi:hypothetical protein